MKTQKEINEMIKKCIMLRKGIPHFSAFGVDNWGSLDKQIKTLTNCLTMVNSDIEAAEIQRLDALDELGQDWCEDPKIQVYDWLLEKTDDDLVSDGDIEVFCKKQKTNLKA